MLIAALVTLLALLGVAAWGLWEAPGIGGTSVSPAREPETEPREIGADETTIPAEDTGTAGTVVPDLVGLSYPEAEGALEREGFVLGGVRQVSSDTVPMGAISGQDPEAGASSGPGTLVFLQTSIGPPDGEQYGPEQYRPAEAPAPR